MNKVNCYKKKIIEIVEKIKNLRYLQFIYEFLKAFQNKWGI